MAHAHVIDAHEVDLVKLQPTSQNACALQGKPVNAFMQQKLSAQDVRAAQSEQGSGKRGGR